MIRKRLLRTVSAQLIYQEALRQGYECTIESTRFNLFSVKIDGVKIFIKGTNLPVNPQSSCLIAHNKFLSKKLFKQQGILVPKSWLVSTIKQARALILKKNIFPCVIKPISGAHGNAIYANIESSQELDTVLAKFALSHKNILIEEHLTGIDYRVLVIGNKVSAVVERIPAHIIGDGKSSIKSLINKFNANPLVGKKYEKPMCKIRINFELLRTLKKNDLKLGSIVIKGETVFLKQNANISAGGISRDVTASVNTHSKSLAVKASKALGMQFCGVDIIYNPKTKKSYVLEVNDCPGIDIHHFPVIGEAQNVARDIVKYIITNRTDELALTNTLFSYEDSGINILRRN